MINKELISISEAAKILGVHPDTLRKWDYPKCITTRGGHRRYNRREIESYYTSKNRRVRIEVSPLLLANLFTDGDVAYAIKDGLPKGAELVGVTTNHYNGNIVFFFSHNSFAHVHEASETPLLTPTMFRPECPIG